MIIVLGVIGLLVVWVVSDISGRAIRIWSLSETDRGQYRLLGHIYIMVAAIIQTLYLLSLVLLVASDSSLPRNYIKSALSIALVANAVFCYWLVTSRAKTYKPHEQRKGASIQQDQ
jgi:hypothetical protein